MKSNAKNARAAKPEEIAAQIELTAQFVAAFGLEFVARPAGREMLEMAWPHFRAGRCIVFAQVKGRAFVGWPHGSIGPLRAQIDNDAGNA